MSKSQGEREEQLQLIKQGCKTTAIYESPNRLLKTLHSIAEVFGQKHKVYVGLELTKRHEKHLKDTVERVIESLTEQLEGSRLKGEVTMVLGPWQEDEEYLSILKDQQFNPNKDAQVKVNLLQVAKKLDASIEMSEGEFRDLLKAMFSEVPSYHIATVVRLVRQTQRKRLSVLSERLDGII